MSAMGQDPVVVSFLGLPGLVVLWVSTLVAFGVFGWRVSQLVGLVRRGRPENRFDQPAKRVAERGQARLPPAAHLQRAEPSGCPTS